ncbi:hypothetical protein LTR29_018092 [Friedmanniomyces endolithicus]|nr:hypothetical protein LTR29_018092 [Friedmanniomyces endolithicus]
MASQRTYKLVTVNSNPERAKMIVGKVIEAVKDQFTIVHAANADSPGAARPIFEEIVPDIVVRLPVPTSNTYPPSEGVTVRSLDVVARAKLPRLRAS